VSIEQIRAEIANLPVQEQDRLAAYLTHLRHQRDPNWASETARKIDDANPANWMTLDELRKHWES
jgi:hypothetical protein